MTSLMTSPCILLLTSSVAWMGLGAAMPAEPGPPLIGDTEQIYTLPKENTEIRGLAVDETAAEVPQLLVLDRSGKVFAYRIDRHAKKEVGPLEPLRVYDLSATGQDKRPLLTDPRGLAFAREDGHPILYTLSRDKSEEIASRLWRFNLDSGKTADANLSLFHFRIGDREPLGITVDDGQLLVNYESAGYADANLRARRGIIRLEWPPPHDALPQFVRHMPDAGTLASHGLAAMKTEGARYLWSTVGDTHIYCADAPTGRGLFAFERPRSVDTGSVCRGLAFGQGSLWVSENAPGPDRVHRVNVTRNLDALREGPRILRHLVMAINTRPEKDGDKAGRVSHNYSRPYTYEQLHNQGFWPETEKIVDLTKAPNATIRHFSYDPADDVTARQEMLSVEYAEAPAHPYASQYELDVWTNSCRSYVYPHRANHQRDGFSGIGYLADDPELYNLSDTKTYRAFIARVTAHIKAKYDADADMRNPYWAARNVLEYIQDTYYYPIPPLMRPATVDYSRKHYDANPANLKIELSDRPYDKTQIIACSGTSVILAGAMRHLGIPARWLGTAAERDPKTWDTNGNGFLDTDETAPCTNGHRYTQVWLGNHYGWVCFDATPSRPASSDYDVPPPFQPQWRFMSRAAAGHMVERRIVFNVGSALFRPLYRDFEYDQRLALENNCGGDQRYNLQARFEKPELWRLPGNRIELKNTCFIRDVKTTGPKLKTRVTWRLEGQWGKDPNATLSIDLQQLPPKGNKPRQTTTVARGIRASAQSAVVNLSGHTGKRCRLLLRKDGDSETGNCSELFELESHAEER
ncbi:MAG: transglutaminase domain-containing protein [Phycisphaerae bacterium]|nr:transglutaminase domain-containing protein [Phycisphaerae bacterium]